MTLATREGGGTKRLLLDKKSLNSGVGEMLAVVYVEAGDADALFQIEEGQQMKETKLKQQGGPKKPATLADVGDDETNGNVVLI